VSSTRRRAGPGGADAPWPQVPGAQRALRRFLRAIRQIVGAPDYERYLEHCAASHPERPPLSAREYYADFVTRRFGGGPSRCC
jgi:uncharacterized short protein YbdD (DUF466 family)